MRNKKNLRVAKYFWLVVYVFIDKQKKKETEYKDILYMYIRLW